MDDNFHFQNVHCTLRLTHFFKNQINLMNSERDIEKEKKRKLQERDHLMLSTFYRMLQKLQKTCQIIMV